MILAMNLMGWATLIIGFAGVFSSSVPKWMGLVVMAVGALSMFASWSLSRARPYEPLLASLVLIGVMVLGFASEARAWFPGLVLVAALAHIAAAAESAHLAFKLRDRDRGDVHSRAFFWRRVRRHA